MIAGRRPPAGRFESTVAAGVARAWVATLQRWARGAGFMYLFVMATYLGGIAITSHCVVRGDLAATARQIAADETLYRVGLALQLVASGTTIGLAGAFYALLRPVAPNLALLALLWRTAEATLGGATAVVTFVALENLRGGGDAAGGAGPPFLLARLLTAGHVAAFHVTLIFFSLGSVLYFGLLWKSRYIPRALAAFGLLASVIVALPGFARLILPSLADPLAIAWAPIFIAEFATGTLLLVRGATRAAAAGGDGAGPAARPEIARAIAGSAPPGVRASRRWPAESGP